MRPRVIPVLLIDENNRLVKTRCFKNPVYIGDPHNAVRIFNEKEVDEIIFLNISSSKQNTKPDIPYLKRLAGECFMPTCYGGGITTLKEIETILMSGFERVTINSAIIENPLFIQEIVAHFGSSTLVVCVDVVKDKKGNYNLYHAAKNKIISVPLFQYIKKIEELGAGEILLNSVYLDGTGFGYDLDLIKQTSSMVSVPVIACGGSSCHSDFSAAIHSGASAVAAGRQFVFYGKHDAVLIQYPDNVQLNNIFNAD